MNEIRSTLLGDQHLTTSQHAAVLTALERLAERLSLAESSRDAAVTQLGTLRKSYRVNVIAYMDELVINCISI